MEKYLEVQRKNSEDQKKVGEWLAECQTENRPCVVIYYDGEKAYISASIKGLVNNLNLEVKVDKETIDACFLNLISTCSEIQQSYLNHNGSYFTFDNIPKQKAKGVALEIYDILEKLITIKSC